jgi:hypothetical protein
MIRQYIFLAVGCVAVGIVITFAVLAVCQRLGISIDENLWIVAIPAVLSVLLNIALVEIYQAYRRKHR